MGPFKEKNNMMKISVKESPRVTGTGEEELADTPSLREEGV